MALPNLNHAGELPIGIYQATIDEVIARFGSGTLQREIVTARLQRIYQIAKDTGNLQQLVIFGSYITAKPEPNDVDVVIIFSDDFDLTVCSEDVKRLLNHQKAENEFGASIFWIRPSLLLLETLDEFIEGWQVKHDGTRRGIIEVRNNLQ
jgi:predicted nucleotidyltransferase